MNLRPGRYTCQVVAPSNGWFGEAGEKQTPYLRIPLVVTQGAHEGEEVTYQGWLTTTSHIRTVDNLKEIFEWDGDLVKLARLSSTGPFVGKLCSIVCEEEEYKDKKRVVIKWINGADGGDKLMDVNRALQLAQKLMGVAPEEEAKAKPRAAYGQTPPQKDPDLDVNQPDIPWE